MLKLTLFIIFTFYSLYGLTCSSFNYEDSSGDKWVAKSFDFHNGNGLLFVNKRGVYKRSLTLSMDIGFSWVSKYGSVTFNQAGRDFPFGGMNEKSLNMEILWLSETKYPVNTNLIKFNESQVIQYILDSAATTDEALTLIREIEITPIMAPVHYTICDIEQKCAVVEYLNGELVITEMGDTKERILQNSKYSHTLNKLRNEGRTSRNSSNDINSIFDNPENETSAIVNKGFRNLDIVKQGTHTKWQIQYNQSDKKIWFKTFNSNGVKTINLNELDFICSGDSSEKVFPLQVSEVTEDITSHLENYTFEKNKLLINSFRGAPSWLKTLVNFYSTANHVCRETHEDLVNKLLYGDDNE